jgi:uncharacterized protein (DUF111 family)
MLALLDLDALAGARERMELAARNQGVRFELTEIEADGDSGLGISYTEHGHGQHGASYDDCFSRLAKAEEDLESRSAIGRSILEHIFRAEGEAHGVQPREVHLHELARPQAVMNIAGIGKAASMLLEAGAEGFVCSTIVTGSGVVVVSHGAFRVPAPASKILLRGLRHEPGDSPGERASPTGVAAAKVLAGSQSDDIPGRFQRKGVGFGTKRFSGRLGRDTLYWA